MKTSLIILIILFVIPDLIQAQSRISLGIKAGLSIPNLTSGNTENPISRGYGSRLGIDAAIHAEFHLTKHFSIQPQLEYSSQGGKKDGNQAFPVPPEFAPFFPPGTQPDYLYADYKSTAKINYLMLPILAKYRWDLGKKWGMYVAAGPFASIVVSANNKTTGTSLIYLDEDHKQPLAAPAQSFDREEGIKDELHKANAGISGHVGLNYLLPKSAIFIEAGGNYGFVNIQKNEINGKNRTGAAVVVVGYAFDL